MSADTARRRTCKTLVAAPPGLCLANSCGLALHRTALARMARSPGPAVLLYHAIGQIAGISGILFTGLKEGGLWRWLFLGGIVAGAGLAAQLFPSLNIVSRPHPGFWLLALSGLLVGWVNNAPKCQPVGALSAPKTRCSTEFWRADGFSIREVLALLRGYFCAVSCGYCGFAIFAKPVPLASVAGIQEQKKKKAGHISV